MEGKIKSFHDLEAWKESYKLTIIIYEITRIFPREELFGLTNQLRRAAVSVSSNIAEGFGRETGKDKSHFYVMARTSIMEIQNQLLIARGVGYLNEENFMKAANQSVKAHKILNGLIKSTKNFI
jgi:four helix bundle protein